MANEKIDSLTLPNGSGTTTTYDIDLPADATPSIASITTSGNAVIGGTISEGGTLLSNKYQAKQNDYVRGTGTNGKIAQWSGTGTINAGSYSVQDLVDLATGQTTGFVTNTTQMAGLKVTTNTVTVTSFKDADGTAVALDKFGIGDIVYLTDTDYPDRWVSKINTSPASIELTVIDAKTDLSAYSKKTHTHTYSTTKNISVTGSYDKTTGVTISVGSGTANYTPAGSVSVTRGTDVAVDTTTVNSITAVGTLPSLTTKTLTFAGGSAASLKKGTTDVSSFDAVKSFNGGSAASMTYNTTASGGEAYVKAISSTGASASGTDTFVKTIDGGSGSFTPTTRYLHKGTTSVVTGVTSNGTAKAGSETHTHSVTAAGTVDLGSNTTSTDGVLYVESISSTGASGTTKYFHPSFTGSSVTSGGPSGTATSVPTANHTHGVTLTVNDATSTGAATYVQSISGGSGSFSGTRATSGSGTSARRTLTLSHSHTGASATTKYLTASTSATGSTTTVANATHTHSVTAAGSVSLGSNTTSTDGVAYISAVSGGTTTATSKYFHPSFTGSAVNSGAPSGTTTFLTGVKASGTVDAITSLAANTTSATGDITYLESAAHTHVGASVASSADAVTGVTGGTTSATTQYMHFAGGSAASLTTDTLTFGAGSVATLKEGTTAVSSFKSVDTFDQGTLPTKGNNTTVATGIKTQPAFSGSFTGTAVQLVATPNTTPTNITSTGDNTISGTTSAASE